MLRYEMDLSKFEGERVIYSALEWLGDIGGVIDAIRYIAMMFLYFLSFQPLNRKLVSRLFRVGDLYSEKIIDGIKVSYKSDKYKERLKQREDLTMSFCSQVKASLLQYFPCSAVKFLSNREKAYFKAVRILQ